jgi:RNA polymerase sigma-70 factor (ECF subfamily)
VFERALRYRDSFDCAKGTPTAWLLGIAQRTVDDLLRERAVQAHRRAGDGAIGGRDDADPVSRIAVQRALAQLAERDRELLALRYGVGLPSKQIASALDLKPGAVDVALHRARERLSQALAGEDDVPALARAGGA